MICDKDFKRRVLVYIRRIMIEEEYISIIYIYIIIVNLRKPSISELITLIIIVLLYRFVILKMINKNT